LGWLHDKAAILKAISLSALINTMDKGIMACYGHL